MANLVVKRLNNNLYIWQFEGTTIFNSVYAFKSESFIEILIVI